MVIVDTSVWIRALRPGASPERQEVDQLLRQRDVAMVGPVLAEVLQGARSRHEFEELQIRLTSLPYFAETRETWIRVGDLSYQLRQHGMSLALVDVLIAALALEQGCEVYTFDEHFQRVPGLNLYQPEAR